MIDIEKFNNIYQDFDNETTILIIDMFAEQQPEIIRDIAQNIEDYDIVQVKSNSHKLKGTCGQLFDPESHLHAKVMEDAALEQIIEIVKVLLKEHPDTLKGLKEKFDGTTALYLEIVKKSTIKNFLTEILGSFSAEQALELERLEKDFMVEVITPMFLNLETSSAALLSELLSIKKELLKK